MPHWNGSAFGSGMAQWLWLETRLLGTEEQWEQRGSVGSVCPGRVAEWARENRQGASTRYRHWEGDGGLLCGNISRSAGREDTQRAPETREKTSQKGCGGKDAIWPGSTSDWLQQGCLLHWSATAGLADEALLFLPFAVFSFLYWKPCVIYQLGEETTPLVVSFTCNRS